MHTPECAKYPPLTLVEILLSFLKIKQGDNEDLIDYLSRFKSEMTVVFSLFGKKILDGFCKEQTEYKALVVDKSKKSSKRKPWIHLSQYFSCGILIMIGTTVC